MRAFRNVEWSILRRSSQLAGVLGLLFILMTLAHIYWYRVSFTLAIQLLLKEAVLIAINAATRVYDPYYPQLAQLGPQDAPHLDLAHYRRIEDVLPSSPMAITSQDKRIILAQVHNEQIIRSTYKFSYQPYDEPALHQLRAKYHLDDVVAGAVDEFEAMVLLRNWTRSQFRKSDYHPAVSNFDALEILDRRLRNHTGEKYQPGKHMDLCHFFPLLYCQIMLSMGHQARLVSIGHGMSEVWSNQYGKWVVMDVELNQHFEKDGMPLNMLEMFEENYVEKPSQARIVRGQQSSGDVNTTMVGLGVEGLSAEILQLLHSKPHPPMVDLRVEELPIESLIRAHYGPLDIVEMRNDWLTNRYFRGHPARSERNSLIYTDPRLAQPRSLYARLRPHTKNKNDVYWTLNQTEILAHQAVDTEVLQLAFRTVTPNFDSFEITLDGAPPSRTTSSTFGWRLHAGVNTLAVRTVNQFAVKGLASFVAVLAYKELNGSSTSNRGPRTTAP